MQRNNPLRAESFIARTEAEIVSSAGSKYCPVPANVALKEISCTPGKYAIVGLPCHIEAARKMEQHNKTLKDRIALHIGLVCHHAPTSLATEYLLRRLEIAGSQVAKVDYRVGMRPGKMKISLRNGSEVEVQYADVLYWGGIFSSFFYPWRCLFCEDKMCLLGDISFMDAWLPRYSKEKRGLSLIVSRSQIGQEILRDASLAGKVRLDEVSVQEIVEAQKLPLFRRRALSRVSLLKSLRIGVPTFDCSLSRAGFIDYLKAISQFLSVYVSENRATWFLLDRYLQILRLVHPDHVDRPHVEVDWDTSLDSNAIPSTR
jgi:coenzyme F420 hydrogenase subunit beta